MILANIDLGLYKFRRELVERLLEDNEVYICLPDGQYVERLVSMGAKFVPCNLLERRGTNPLKEIKLMQYYRRTLSEIKPDLVLTYTIKPNLYCNSFKHKTYSIANITGLGTAFNKKGLLNKIILFLYKKSFQNVNHIMFQNQANYNTFVSSKIPINSYSIIPGSGVNIDKFQYKPFEKHVKRNFLFASRFVKEKGIQLLINAIPEVLKKNKNVKINIEIKKG